MKDIMLMSQKLKEKRGDKGFTLMEMLIVVAIIAILVAIAIPVFTSQLNNARVATDEANIRSGYALVSATVLTANPAIADDTSFGLNSNGTITAAGTATGSWTALGNNSTAVNIGGASLTWATGDSVTYKYTGGAVTITKA